MSNEADPVVFCHGLFGWGDTELGGYPYFFCAQKLKEEQRDSLPPFLFPATGPISSLHDQACELFYQLKGGRVNFGGAHSEKFGHARYARDYTGKALYPEWDENHPLDFVSHSMGAPVVRMLQYLLETGFFAAEDEVAYGTSSRWVRSLTTLSGVHNGSTLTWILGASEETGLIQKDAYLVRIVADLLERYAQLQSKYTKLGEWYDLQLDQWGLASGGTSRLDLQKLFSEPVFIESEDWALYDLSLNAMENWNRVLVEYPGTWYFSYVTRSTLPFLGIDLPLPVFTHWFLSLFAFRIGTFKFRTAKWKDQHSRLWHANDGMCPAHSQDYPHLGRTAEALKVRYGKTPADLPYRTGIWHIKEKFGNVDHAEIAMLPHFWRRKSGKKMYRSIIDTILEIRNIHER